MDVVDARAVDGDVHHVAGDVRLAAFGGLGAIDAGALGHDLLAVEDHEEVLDLVAGLELRQDDVRQLAEVLAFDGAPVVVFTRRK